MNEQLGLAVASEPLWLALQVGGAEPPWATDRMRRVEIERLIQQVAAGELRAGLVLTCPDLSQGERFTADFTFMGEPCRFPSYEALLRSMGAELRLPLPTQDGLVFVPPRETAGADLAVVQQELLDHLSAVIEARRPLWCGEPVRQRHPASRARAEAAMAQDLSLLLHRSAVAGVWPSDAPAVSELIAELGRRGLELRAMGAAPAPSTETQTASAPTLDEPAIREWSARRDDVVRRSLSPTAQAALDAIFAGEGATVLALTHESHYLAVLLSLTAFARASKPLCIMFDDVHRNPGNRAFWNAVDELSDHVSALPANGSGLRKAVRALRGGAVLLVFADLVTDPFAAQTVPWFGQARSTMTGAAWLAASSGADLIACVAAPSGDDLRLAPPLKPDEGGPANHQMYLLNQQLWAEFQRLSEEPASAPGPHGPGRWTPHLFAEVVTTDALRAVVARVLYPWPGSMRPDGSVRALLSSKA